MTFKDYEALIQSAPEAEARVRGILRGGHVVGDEFVAHAGSYGVVREPLENVEITRRYDREETSCAP